MKVARVEVDGAPRVAVVEEGELQLLPPAAQVLDVLAAGDAEPTGERVRVSDARLLPPVEPPSVRDFLTFEQHVTAMVKLHVPPRDVAPEWYDAPTFYFSNPAALVGARDDVQVPPGCNVLDYELELAAVVGRDCRDVLPEDASAHIAGYTIFNDWSARDLQFAEMQVGLGPAKGKDSAITLGPWIVTPDELGGFDLRMEVFVNGELRGSDTCASMAWRFEDLLAYASRGTTVRAGDVLGSGTCGAGCLAELWSDNGGRREPPPLQPGDVVRMEVEGIGAIENRVVAGVEPVPVAKARRR